MHDARHQLFSHTGLPEDRDRQIGGSDPLRERVEVTHRLLFDDQLVERVCAFGAPANPRQQGVRTTRVGGVLGDGVGRGCAHLTQRGHEPARDLICLLGCRVEREEREGAVIEASEDIRLAQRRHQRLGDDAIGLAGCIDPMTAN